MMTLVGAQVLISTYYKCAYVLKETTISDEPLIIK